MTSSAEHENPVEPDNGWHIFTGEDEPHDGIARLPEAPKWRRYTDSRNQDASTSRRARFQVSEKEREMVNAALYLRRPLLVTGKPGVGKSSLAHAVAR